MPQSRRVSPRIPYDEAICLVRVDGKGRLYGRGLNLSADGLSLLCAEPCPIDTEIRCNLLLPHGPRPVSGKIVRVTAAAGGFELAIAFGELKPGTAGTIDHLIAERVSPPATASRSADTLPLHPVQTDALADARHARTKRYGTPSASSERGAPPITLLPTNLPPACGHPLPSVVLTAGLARAAETRPPRQRLRATAVVARPADLGPWGLRHAAAGASHGPPAAAIVTERLSTLEMLGWWPRWIPARLPTWMPDWAGKTLAVVVPAALVVLLGALAGALPHLHR
jgi:hypothetical protein